MFAQGDTGVEHLHRLAPVEGLQDRLEQSLALLQALQALGQAGTIERLGQVGIGLMLQCTEHHGLAGFGGDHDEYRLMADQLFFHQVFEHLLAVLLAVTQVKVLQDEVVGLLRAHFQRLLTGIGSVHFLDAQFAQHRPDRTAEVREIIDDQKTLLVIRQHRRFPGNLRRRTQRQIHGRTQLRSPCFGAQMITGGTRLSNTFS
ncbi:hypothetical protein D9M69_470200 [compost metagenome]